MSFAFAILADLLAALAPEINGGGVEENQVNRAEKIPPLPEEFLLNPVFGAAGRLQDPSTGLVFERFAQKGHGAIQVVQVQRFGAR